MKDECSNDEQGELLHTEKQDEWMKKRMNAEANS
jgi:hypothetical protein